MEYGLHILIRRTVRETDFGTWREHSGYVDDSSETLGVLLGHVVEVVEASRK